MTACQAQMRDYSDTFGGHISQEIAKSTAERFLRLFPSWQEAFRRVADPSSAFSR